jgi:hypothetical protein
LTVPILVVKLALAHLTQIIFVEVVACIALFAKRFKPVLADVVVVVAVVVVPCGSGLRRSGMAVRTSSTKGTVAGEEGRADGRRGYEGVAGGFEEGHEGECWGWFCGCSGKDGGCSGGGVLHRGRRRRCERLKVRRGLVVESKEMPALYRKLTTCAGLEMQESHVIKNIRAGYSFTRDRNTTVPAGG